MPYSMNPDENRENAYSPSKQMNMENQLIYKVSALESTIKGFMARFDERFDSLRKELTDRHTGVIEDVAELKAEQHSLSKRIDAAEKWQTIITTRLVTAGSAIVVVWTLFGRAIQDFLYRTF